MEISPQVRFMKNNQILKTPNSKKPISRVQTFHSDKNYDSESKSGKNFASPPSLSPHPGLRLSVSRAIVPLPLIQMQRTQIILHQK